jgi:hypothetical protein
MLISKDISKYIQLMPNQFQCHWTHGKALPGWNEYFYLMETDGKAPYLAAWYLIRPH